MNYCIPGHIRPLDLVVSGQMLNWMESMASNYLSFKHNCFWAYSRRGEMFESVEGNFTRDENNHVKSIFTYYSRPDTFIGVIDIGKENTWTQLDGTKIDSSFTKTFDLNNNQPNGGSSQNCIVIDMEPHTYFRPDKTQDKSCFSSFKTTAMICYADKKGTWIFQHRIYEEYV